jgi:hypothetical protein
VLPPSRQGSAPNLWRPRLQTGITKQASDAPMPARPAGTLEYAYNQVQPATHDASLVFGQTAGERACQQPSKGSVPQDLGNPSAKIRRHTATRGLPSNKHRSRGQPAPFLLSGRFMQPRPPLSLNLVNARPPAQALLAQVEAAMDDADCQRRPKPRLAPAWTRGSSGAWYWQEPLRR